MPIYKTYEGARRYTRPGHKVEQVAGGYKIVKIPVAQQRAAAARLQERIAAVKVKEDAAKAAYLEFVREHPDQRGMSPADNRKVRELNSRWADYQNERKSLERPVTRF